MSDSPKTKGKLSDTSFLKIVVELESQ